MASMQELDGENFDPKEIQSLLDIQDVLKDMEELADGLSLLTLNNSDIFGNEIVPFRMVLNTIATTCEKCCDYLAEHKSKT